GFSRLLSYLRQQPLEHPLVVEPLPGQLASCPAVSRVVRIDLFDRGDNLVQGREAIKALTRRQHVAEAGFLRDDWTSRRQVLGAPLAEPAAPQADVLVLGDGELAAGTSNILPVGVQV